MMNQSCTYIFVIILIFTQSCAAQNHPGLILTIEGTKAIRADKNSYALFDRALQLTQTEVDREIDLGIDVPIPKDMAGGYTHERHKTNFFILQKAGNLYQITGKVKYAKFVKEMLLEYARMYPTLPLHPTQRSYATGKLFWQCLNDANWLVYVSQAYDCIYEYLNEEERNLLEKDLFRPMADFLSIGNPQFYNRIHNHSTWGNAAVGMIGLAMDDQELVSRALYGLKDDNLSQFDKDNDGGFIVNQEIKERGFLAQLDYSFSPDGYFTEGPYYLRYAIFPFMVFGKALMNKKPDLDLINYRDRILEKATYALLNQSDPNGLFFPINDAQKGMSWEARELVTAVNIIYHYNRDPELLSIAKKQGMVLLDESGFAVAKAIQEGVDRDFVQKPIVFVDGPDGTKGGVGVLRTNDGDKTTLVMKYSAQGMGHGHFDKLSFSLYDITGEVAQDYGAARWVNIDQKGGGRYLKENNTFAKQSIAHNTLVVNKTSHYNGELEKGEKNQPEYYFSDLSNNRCQVISAIDMHAYPGITMHRTMILMQDDHFRNPLIIDLMKVKSHETNLYELPLWFIGHHMDANFSLQVNLTSLQPMGDGHGYQHIWHEGSDYIDGMSPQFTWFGNGRFYTITSSGMQGDLITFGRSGANDPDFNLRHDPVYIRSRQADNTIFASVIESHGQYNPVAEIPLSPYSGIESVEVLYDVDPYSVIKIKHKSGTNWKIAVAHDDNNIESLHQIVINGKTTKWSGVYHVFEN